MCAPTEKGGIKLKKGIAILFAMLFLLFMPSLTKWRMLATANPRVIYVPTDFPTIQGAINNAVSGDTIFVHNGTYYEDISINKSVSLIGENRDLTVIYGLEAQYVIYITANDVSLWSFSVKSNALNPYGSGIFIYLVGNIVICNDSITDSYDGLVTYTSGGNQVSGNIILNNSNSGASSYFSSNNVFSGNTISNNGAGLNFRSSSNNVFSGNTISNNDAGVNLFASSNNIFYHNNFLSPIQVSSDSENIWSQNSEGNYWSSYKGLDSNSNGIGDTPYQIDAHNIDNYPLMGAFYDFNVVSGNMTYEVSVICNSTVSGFRYEIGQQTGNKIIHFDVNDENVTAGFCRLMIPTELMNLPYIVLDSEGEITPTSLSASNETNAYLYFTYLGNSQTITVISSKTLQLYQELSKELSDNQTALLADLDYLNAIYYGLLNNYTILLDHFNQLQNSYLSLNSSYQEHLSSYSENIQNVQNLVYIFAATTMVFLVTTVYLSRRAHASFRQKASNV